MLPIAPKNQSEKATIIKFDRFADSHKSHKYPQKRTGNSLRNKMKYSRCPPSIPSIKSSVMKSSVMKSRVHIRRPPRATKVQSQSDPTLSGKVHFSEDDSCKTILVETASSSQRNLLWYTKDEMKTLQKASRQEGAYVATNNAGSSQIVRHRCVRAILEQQSEHQTLGITDPKGLFVLSRACTKVSRKIAQTEAIRVAEEVLSEDF
jgi:hypothetical protein